MAAKEKYIEFPSQGATYCHQKYGVYAYDEYPRYSVLAGMERRCWLGEYDTLAEAQAAHPDAIEASGSCFTEPNLSHLSNGGDGEPFTDEEY